MISERAFWAAIVSALVFCVAALALAASVIAWIAVK